MKAVQSRLTMGLWDSWNHGLIWLSSFDAAPKVQGIYRDTHRPIRIGILCHRIHLCWAWKQPLQCLQHIRDIKICHEINVKAIPWATRQWNASIPKPWRKGWEACLRLHRNQMRNRSIQIASLSPAFLYLFRMGRICESLRHTVHRGWGMQYVHIRRKHLQHNILRGNGSTDSIWESSRIWRLLQKWLETVGNEAITFSTWIPKLKCANWLQTMGRLMTSLALELQFLERSSWSPLLAMASWCTSSTPQALNSSRNSRWHQDTSTCTEFIPDGPKNTATRSTQHTWDKKVWHEINHSLGYMATKHISTKTMRRRPRTWLHWDELRNRY